jgi:hypothetical protein
MTNAAQISGAAAVAAAIVIGLLSLLPSRLFVRLLLFWLDQKTASPTCQVRPVRACAQTHDLAATSPRV